MESINEKNLDQLNFLHNQFNINPKGVKDRVDENLTELLEKNSKNDDRSKKINSVLILDTETSGLDESKDELVEVGCILFNVPTKAVLSQLSFLLPVSSNNAEYINGISPIVSNCSQPWAESINLFLKFLECSDLIIAHNVEFDKKWFGRGKLPLLKKKWVCSLEDINWSFKKTLKSRPSVTDLALAFGIPVWNLHRALSDCYYLAEVFKRCENLENLLLQASEPKYLYKAIVSYEERSLAKSAGFRWNNPVQGAWTRKLSQNEAIKLDFKVEILNLK